jgi:hypothetical protein
MYQPYKTLFCLLPVVSRSSCGQVRLKSQSGCKAGLVTIIVSVKADFLTPRPALPGFTLGIEKAVKREGVLRWVHCFTIEQISLPKMGMSPGLGNLVLPPFCNPDTLRSSLHASAPRSGNKSGNKSGNPSGRPPQFETGFASGDGEMWMPGFAYGSRSE